MIFQYLLVATLGPLMCLCNVKPLIQSPTSKFPSPSRMSSTTRPIVFMDINIGETPAGRMKMELFSDIVPK